MMIPLNIFLSNVQRNVERVHNYEYTHDGSDGLCDCIGLIIGAVRLSGGTWRWTHGSNYAARNRIRDLHYISSASQLKLGDIVFKAREPGEAKYRLPNTYDDSPDRRDYYHVGVVTSTAPFVVTHCTSVEGGIMRDTKLGAWHYGGELNLVDYEEGGDTVEENYKAKVVAAQGSTVNMRKSASSKADVVRKIPIGTIVTVIKEYNDGWDYIGIDGTTGYMMKQFLQKVNDDNTDENDYVTITLRKDVYEALKESVIDAGGI